MGPSGVVETRPLVPLHGPLTGDGHQVVGGSGKGLPFRALDIHLHRQRFGLAGNRPHGVKVDEGGCRTIIAGPDAEASEGCAGKRARRTLDGVVELPYVTGAGE